MDSYLEVVIILNELLTNYKYDRESESKNIKIMKISTHKSFHF